MRKATQTTGVLMATAPFFDSTMFRSPTPKSSDFARTGVQANFHQRPTANNDWFDAGSVSNVHLHVK